MRPPVTYFSIVYLRSRLGTTGHPVKFILRGQEGLKQARRRDRSQRSMFLLEIINKNETSFQVSISALSKLQNGPRHSQENSWHWGGTAWNAGQAPAQTLCDALMSRCEGFSCRPPSLCSLKRNASCWEANRIKLVHKCKEALRKDGGQALLGFAPG